jgi:hypothetical protein
MELVTGLTVLQRDGVIGRETKEGWPLLTVETEVNGDSKRTNERGPSLVGSLNCLVMPLPRDFYPALAALGGPVQDINFKLI